MPMTEPSVTTSIRITPTLRDQLKRIAEHERRTTNNFIRISLEDVVARYLSEHPELAERKGERE